MSLHLQNYVEVAVREHVNEVLDAQGICSCDQCRMDVMALALNKLPPHYVVSEKGELFAKADAFTIQASVDIIAELTAAAQMVKSRPRHSI